MDIKCFIDAGFLHQFPVDILSLIFWRCNKWLKK